MDPHCFLDQVHFAVPLCLDLPLGTREMSRRATGSETKCCAPAKQCDTAQVGRGDDGSQNKMNYIIHTRFTRFNTGYIAGVGPLNNTIGEAPKAPR